MIQNVNLILGRSIRMKTSNLTRSHARSDPINRRIQGFLFRDFKNKVRHSRCDFFQFFKPIIDFNYSSDTEMILEEVEIKWFLNYGV